MTKRAMGDLQQQPEGTSVSDNLKLPPGFRFHPRDEEIITFYLAPKVMERDFTCTVIGEVDLNRTEPWDLPGKAKMRGNEWYFFYRKDRKYPTGIRANRATEAGYWKATGKDKEIYRPIVGEVLPELVGMKKTLVFYKGRAPRGEKTNWVMHEFRLEGNNKVSCPTSSSTSTGTTKSSSASKDEWVVCRVFNKTAGTKKTHTPSLYDIAMANGGIDQSIIPMPMPMPMAMQLPILPDFTADPTMSYYSTTAMGSMSVPPMMPPMAGMGNNGLQMNDSLFGNPMAPVMPMSFYHQMGMGATGDNGFMATPESGPS